MGNRKVTSFLGKDSLTALIASGDKPARLSAHEIHDLDIHAACIASVKEALDSDPVQYIGYRELSRFASHDAIEQMQQSPFVQELRSLNTEYKDKRRSLGIDVQTAEYKRKEWNAILKSATDSYHPRQESAILHIWLWSYDDKNMLGSILPDTGLSNIHFYAFIAESLSTLSNLGDIAASAHSEYEHCLSSMRHLIWEYKFVISEIDEIHQITGRK